VASPDALRVFIGFDARQIVSYTVLQLSIIAKASKPVAITPLILETLPIQRRGLTPFTFSRFLVPYLCGYEGHAIFLDADMMLRDDIHKLAKCNDGKSDVLVVNHQGSLAFEKSSVMLFNCSKCATLTPEYIEDGRNGLHDFAWAKQVGELPHEWNHLVGYEATDPKTKLAHFTQGVPAFPETAKSEFAAEWTALMARSTSTRSWQEIMGTSVHAAPVMERLKELNAA
jgi:hypothetical protein